MAKGTILMDLKEVIYSMVDNNGNFRTMPIGFVKEKELPTDRVRILKDLITILRDTSIICVETKVYIFNRYITIKGVNDTMNEMGDKQIPYNTTSSKIQYDRSKLERTFGISVLNDIMNVEKDILEYVCILAELYIKYFQKGKDIRELLVLPFERNTIYTELDDESFNSFVDSIKMFSKLHIKSVADNIPIEQVGYFNFITTSPSLSEVDKQRLSEIKQLLIEGYTGD